LIAALTWCTERWVTGHHEPRDKQQTSNRNSHLPVPAETAIASGAHMIFRPQDAVILLPNGSLPAGAVSADAVIGYREFPRLFGSIPRSAGNTRVLVDAPFRSGDAVLKAGDQIRIAIFTRSLRWLAE
jgi:hypothetical protein